MSEDEECAHTEARIECARLMPLCIAKQLPAYLEVKEEECCGVDGDVGKAPAHLVGWEAKELWRHAPRERVARAVRVHTRQLVVHTGHGHRPWLRRRACWPEGIWTCTPSTELHT